MATITDRRGYHTLNWSGPDTDPKTGKLKRHRTALGKVGTIPKRDLDDILRIKGYELSTGARLLNVHRRPAPRFEDFARDYLVWHQAEYPDSNYRVAQIISDHLSPYFGLTPLNLITVQQAEDYKTTRRPLVRGSTLTKELRVLHAVVNRAVDLKTITENPISIVQGPQHLDSKPHRWYSKAELAKLYRASSYGPIWKLYANTGMRRKEGLILRTAWVGLKTIKILSTGEERTKDGEWRDIPCTDGAREALAKLKAHGEYVLPRIRKESLSRAFARDARTAGLDGSLQTLRHTFICHMLLAQVPIRTVQLYVGHAKVTTTEGYAYQVLRNDPRAAVRLAI
jgi:integrase